MFFNKRERMYTAPRSELNKKCSKQVNLLMVVDEVNRHSTTTNNISRLLLKLNGKNTRISLFDKLSQWLSDSVIKR